MNKRILISLSVVLLYFVFFHGDPVSDNMPPIISDSTSLREKSYEVDDLFDSRTAFRDLAERGSYTIVEAYTDHCRTCKKLDARFPSLLQERSDFVIRRIHLFSGSVSFHSLQKQRKWQARQEAMSAFYNFRGTPHIEIYDANGDAIAVDEGLNKPGLSTSKMWLGLKT